jgi:hypothetical protein
VPPLLLTTADEVIEKQSDVADCTDPGLFFIFLAGSTQDIPHRVFWAVQGENLERGISKGSVGYHFCNDPLL